MQIVEVVLFTFLIENLANTLLGLLQSRGSHSIKIVIGKPLDKSISIDKLNLSVIDVIN